jgi:hypothetical protein
VYEGTDTIILYNELAYEDVLPVGWLPAAEPFDATTGSRYDEPNLRLLQACAALDEQPATRDKLDDGSPIAAEMARLDFKLTLLLDLVMHLASRDLHRPEPVPIRFNALGATIQSGTLKPAIGSSGVLHIYLRNALPQPLSLPACVGAVEGDTVSLRFLPMSDPVADHVEKLAFRRHRRHVAGVRRPR